ncbi:glycosyltransferase 87 family protein [Streptomyces sp. 8N706]|uniref:glycosyltransferase 87 family protein n=1 Tax=Streptomyces sp. 8N706 TaxID=3457416 RepID=UPI003FD526C1
MVMVTYEEGAVEALQPERSILLPDGVEDLLSDDYADLVAWPDGTQPPEPGSWSSSDGDPGPGLDRAQHPGRRQHDGQEHPGARVCAASPRPRPPARGRGNPTIRSRPGRHDAAVRARCDGRVLTFQTQPEWKHRLLWCGGWLVAAMWAGVFPLLAAPEPHRVWGASAGVGYLCAAGAALWPRGRSVSVGVAVGGAVVVPLLVLLVTGGAQSEVGVIERSGVLTLHQATPYLADPRTVVEVTPYLPGMAVFGLPRAVLGDSGWLPQLGDARLWCTAAFLGCLWGARRVIGRAVGGRVTLGALVASPVVALPLCVSGVDLPLTGLLCLALAYAARRRPLAAGLALAAACSLKWTAWPAIAVAVSLLAQRAGLRAAVRAAAVAVAGTVVLVLPSALLSPGPLVQQVFAFPTGRGEWETPAASPLPGRLLADLGPVGWYAAVALLLAGGLAVGVSLVVRPPHDLVTAADRLALSLCLAFLLAPAGRFGYLALPVLLVVWVRLVRGAPRAVPVRSRLVRTSENPRLIPVGGAR